MLLAERIDEAVRKAVKSAQSGITPRGLPRRSSMP